MGRNPQGPFRGWLRLFVNPGFRFGVSPQRHPGLFTLNTLRDSERRPESFLQLYIKLYPALKCVAIRNQAGKRIYVIPTKCLCPFIKFQRPNLLLRQVRRYLNVNSPGCSRVKPWLYPGYDGLNGLNPEGVRTISHNVTLSYHEKL